MASGNESQLDVGLGTNRDNLTVWWEDAKSACSQKPQESFTRLCARAQKESDIETVAEIVDRLLHAAGENLKMHSERRNRKAVDL